MKYAKINYNKVASVGGASPFKFYYPLNYDARFVGTITWCGTDCVEGDNLKEFVATVADDFPYGVNMVEITRVEVDAFIKEAATRQKATPPIPGRTAKENGESFIANQKSIIDEHKKIDCTCEDMKNSIQGRSVKVPAATMDLSEI